MYAMILRGKVSDDRQEKMNGWSSGCVRPGDGTQVEFSRTKIHDNVNDRCNFARVLER